MDETQIDMQSRSETSTRIAFWGTLAQSVMLILLAMVVAYLSLTGLPSAPTAGVRQTGIIYTVMAAVVVLAGLNIASLIFLFRGRQDRGFGLTYISMIFFMLAITSLIEGRAPFVTLFVLVLSAVGVGWLCPPHLKRSMLITTVVALVLMWMIEWSNPAWRATYTGTQVAPAAAVVFGLIFAVVVASQTWKGNIRLKLVTAFTIIALFSVAILGTVTYVNFRNRVREDMRQRLLNIISLVAMNQDGDLHATIQGPEDATDGSHTELLAQNVDYLSIDSDLKYIYTMRKNEQGQIYFVINARQGGESGDPIGTIYNEPSNLLATRFDTLSGPVVEEELYTDVYGQVLASYAPFYRADGTREGIIGVDIDAEKVIAQERSVLFLILGTTAGTMIVVTLIGLWLGRAFVGPIINLSRTTQEVIEGNLGARAKIETADEVGELAKAFNQMTAQLQSTLQGLEQRVADRTHNLELAAEVGRAVSEVRDLDVMLRGACDLILKEFDLYYVQVYLTDPQETKLVLEAGTGSVGAQLLGRGHNLPFNGNSINGRAAVEKRSVVISDTAESATFRQNPLLPDTRGEMAVPLIVANKVVGVLDMQSREPGVLNKEVLPAFEAMAGQLAVAIQNSNLLAETEEARAEVEKQARRLVRTGWNDHLDAIHKPEKLGFVFSQNEVTALADSDESQIPADGKAVSAPIAITGESLGSLVVEIDDESRRAQTAELVNVVARQVAQQIENLRLLESSERYRYEAEEASRRLTIEGWKSYMERAGEDLGYLYDLNEVRPQVNGSEQVDASSYTLPLKVRDETIGKLVVQGLEESDEQSMNIANAVVERLGAHIESLRQFEETQRGQLELDKRARQLAAVAEVSSVSARELDIQKMLASVVHLTQRKFGLYHAHVFTYTEQTEMLKIMACGWKEGDEHEGTHGTTAIPLDQELSLVALAARLRQPVISNDVHHEAGWLPNPLLPDTQAEMAVPLLIGDKILGVLDVQSDKLNAFSQEDASIFTTLAAQIATALQNAQSFVQAQKQAERESRLNVISQKIQSATTVEAVLQIAARELGHTLGAPLTIAQLGLKETPNDN